MVETASYRIARAAALVGFAAPILGVVVPGWLSGLAVATCGLAAGVIGVLLAVNRERLRDDFVDLYLSRVLPRLSLPRSRPPSHRALSAVFTGGFLAVGIIATGAGVLLLLRLQ